MAKEVIEGVLLEAVVHKSDFVTGFLATDTEELKIAGVMIGPVKNARYRLEGARIAHKEYGLQFRFDNYEELLPLEEESARAFLKMVPNVGEKTADALIQAFNNVERLFSTIENNPEELTKVKGVSLAKAQAIHKFYKDNSLRRSFYPKLMALGLSERVISTLYKQYGYEVLEKIKNDPYGLADEIRGIGFIKADSLARKQGIAMDDPKRIHAGIRYVLDKCGDDGHLCLHQRRLLKETYKILSKNLQPGEELKKVACIDGLTELAMQGFLYITPDGYVFLKENYELEKKTASILAVLANVKPKQFEGNIERMIQRLSQKSGIALASEQLEAIKMFATNSLVIVYGGPGCGKTTVQSMMEGLARAADPDIKILKAAPTGTASEKMGDGATTIHLMLGASFDGNIPVFSYDDKYKLEADILFLDEFSMVGSRMAYNLFRAVTPGTRVVIFGDPDQLESIEPGDVLRSMIESGVIPAVKLKQVFRQKAGSDITTAAYEINEGKIPSAIAKGSKEFYYIPKNDPKDIADTIVRCVKAAVEKKYYRVDQCLVLCPQWETPVGVYALNEMLQRTLNPPSPEKKELLYYGKKESDNPLEPAGNAKFVFRVGDRVMAVNRNRYNVPLFNDPETKVKINNGSRGEVVDVFKPGEVPDLDEPALLVRFNAGDILYPYSDLVNLKHSWAFTGHKSQGSEASLVLMPLAMQNKVMLRRNLLYTIGTRAKEQEILVGQEEALVYAIANVGKRRRTLLKDFLIEAFEPYFKPAEG